MIEEMFSVFVSQVRNVDQTAEVGLLYAEGKTAVVQVTRDKTASSHLFLLVQAPNISSCKGLWWYSDPESVRTFYGVVVFYGEAAVQGAVWDDSSGNKFKDDYRRIIKGQDCYRAGLHRNVFEEPQSLFTEDNLKRLLADEPLVPRKIPSVK